MAKSELGKKLTRAIEAVDKFVEGVKKDGKEVVEAFRVLKDAAEDEPKDK